MYEKVDISKKNTIRSVATNIFQKQSGGDSPFQFVDNRPEVIAQNKRQEIAHDSSEGLSGVAQLRGFKKLNGKAPDSVDEHTGNFVASSLEAWDLVFKDNKIDDAGGIIATYIPGDGALDAEVETKYEAEMTDGEFASVKARGSTGTGIKRYEKQPVETEMVMLKPDKFGAHKQTIQEIIEAAIYGDISGRTANVPAGWIDDLDIEKEEGQSISDYAKANEDNTWLVRAFTELLEEKVNQREGKIAPAALDCLTSGTADFSRHVMATIKERLGLNVVTLNKFVGKDVVLNNVEVLSHEFGHIKTALDVSEASIQHEKSRLGPDWKSVKMVISGLDDSTDPVARTTHTRTVNTNLRFAWGQVLSEFHKSSQNVQKDHKLRDAIRILYNLLVSFEEYFNIEAIDNTIPTGSSEKKRISHGIERLTGHQVEFAMGDDTDHELANRNYNLDANEMAKSVWITKLKGIIKNFIAIYIE